MAKNRIWPEETLALKELACANCGATGRTELAHITKREYDRPRTPGSKTVYVEPESILSLCGPFPEGCHGSYDRGELDIVHLLDTDQQVRAVEDLGSITLALARLAPNAYRRMNEAIHA